jgi:hypothetical protein
VSGGEQHRTSSSSGAHRSQGGWLQWHLGKTCARENRAVSGGNVELPQRRCAELTGEDHRDEVARRGQPWR